MHYRFIMSRRFGGQQIKLRKSAQGINCFYEGSDATTNESQLIIMVLESGGDQGEPQPFRTGLSLREKSILH